MKSTLTRHFILILMEMGSPSIKYLCLLFCISFVHADESAMFNKTIPVCSGGKKIINDTVDLPSSSCRYTVEAIAFQPGDNRSRLFTCGELSPGQPSSADCNISEVARKQLNASISITITSNGSNQQPVIDISLEIGPTGDLNTPETVVFSFVCNKSQDQINKRSSGEYHFDYSTRDGSTTTTVFSTTLSMTAHPDDGTTTTVFSTTPHPDDDKPEAATIIYISVAIAVAVLIALLVLVCYLYKNKILAKRKSRQYELKDNSNEVKAA